ncbi:hypothetical protein [Robertmurraya mangrovi]|nr:hypothetical protein [Bacillus sp. 31A1R]
MTNRKEFKETCIHLCRLTAGTLLEFNQPEINVNFYEAILEYEKEIIHILLNAHYPYLAFAKSVNAFNIDFIDIPRFLPYQEGYRVLTFTELYEPIQYKNHKNHLILNENELNIAELNQIKRWKPAIVGEIIFNFWD